jgi:hypothetical protein
MRRISVFLLLQCMIAAALIQAQGPSGGDTDLTLLLYSYPSVSRQDMSIRDPKGLKVGKNAITGRTFTSAKNATYSLEGQGDLDAISTPVVKGIRLQSPASGGYQLIVTSSTAGSYDLYVTANCAETVVHRQIKRTHILARASQAYSLLFDAENCGKLSIARSPDVRSGRRQ